MSWHYWVAVGCEQVLWLTWCVIWLIAARFTKRSVYRQPLSQRLVYVAIGVGGMLISRQIPVFRHWLVYPNPLTESAGVLLTAAGLTWAVWARVHLGRNWSGWVTVKEDHELIQSGPYRFTRHPIYTGVLLAVLGALLALFPTPGGIAIMALAVLAFGIKLRQEETAMLRQFPEAYPAYKKRVRARLVPWVI